MGAVSFAVDHYYHRIVFVCACDRRISFSDCGVSMEYCSACMLLWAFVSADEWDFCEDAVLGLLQSYNLVVRWD